MHSNHADQRHLGIATWLPGARGRRECRRAGAGLLLFQIPALLLLAVVALVSLYLDVPVSAFVRDATAIAGINPFNGALANVGTMLWSATATVLLFTGVLLRRLDGDWRAGGFYFYFALFTLLLLLDDVFLIHDRFVPTVLELPEAPVYGFYATLALYGLWRFWANFWPRGALLFTIACGFFAVSVVLDVVAPETGGWLFLVEDGAKLLGIFNWCLCFIHLSMAALLDRLQPDRAPWFADQSSAAMDPDPTRRRT